MKTLQEIAAINQLEVVNTTSGSNGYPENIQPALIGFTTPEQMISVMNEFGLECVELMKKDGWDLYKIGRAHV